MKAGPREAALVSIGDEILTGKVLNINLEFLGKSLLEAGIKIMKEISVPDDLSVITDTLRYVAGEFPIVFTTGGLGLTRDDLTRKAISNAFHLVLKEREELREVIKKRVESQGITFGDVHRNYLLVPLGFEPIENDVGIAPGLWGKYEGTYIAVLPGPPRELKAVFKKLLPKLKRLGSGQILYKVIRTFGLKEIEIAQILDPHLDELMPVGFYPSPFVVELRLEASGEDLKTLQENLEERSGRIKRLLGDNVYGEDEDTLEGVLGSLLREKKLTVATAESCTGGLLASLITDVSGSSDYMIGSVVAYHNRIKEQLLGVPRPVLNQHGAVSEPVAFLMAEGVKKLYQVDVGLSTTGIAGPKGGTPQKPVGLVYMGISMREKTKVIRRIFQGNRFEIKKQAALTVIDTARRMLLER